MVNVVNLMTGETWQSHGLWAITALFTERKPLSSPSRLSTSSMG